jgi:hypothetical protein
MTTDFYNSIDYQFRNGQLFQDADGTIPVTEIGQPVGLIKVKSKHDMPEDSDIPLYKAKDQK